ncbi:MAG TPA: zf-HC2 domain-containing protein [Ktedonobacterales bacterium]|nr:zf-HC2 domain-containing protein [Ktedonobacterales bacterium]
MNVPEHPADWEAQRARLSALLDGQLGAAEAAALRAHVSGCASCAAELEALRRVVAVLGALPQPAAPRSFALPLNTELPAEAPAPRPISTAPSRAARWAGITQWAGGLAACVGFFLLFGTLFLGGGSGAQTMAGYFSSARHAPYSTGIGNTTTIQPPAATATAQAVQDTAATPRVGLGAGPTTIAASPSPTATPTTTSGRSPDAQVSAAPPTPRAVAGATGAALLLGGLAALLVGWGMRRRGAPR